MKHASETLYKESAFNTFLYLFVNRITPANHISCIILCLAVIFASPQIYSQNAIEKKISKLASTPGMKVERQPGDILKITYTNGKTRYKAIGEYLGTEHQTTIDSTVIDLTTIDTTLYASKYRFFREVPITAGQNAPLPVYDIDGNGKAELYGYRKDFTTNYDSVKFQVLEYQPTDSSFTKIYTYPDTMYSLLDVYDIDGDGLKEMFSDRKLARKSGIIYRQTSKNTLPTVPYFNYYALAQMNDPQFADLDNDRTTDLLYYCLVDSGFTIISRYNTLTNSLDSVYSFHGNNDMYAAGYSHADIDGDGYPDIVEGTINGNVHVIEYQPGSGYKNTWNGMVETYNAYLHTSTNDIDKNGKPEFWVGGDATYNGVAKTRLTCFEATEDNQYQAVARIDLVGVMSFYAENIFALDVDHDGTEELCLCIDGNFIILKFVGTPGHHAYETYYIKKTEMPDSGFTYLGGSMFDLLNNGTSAIFINMAEDTGRPGDLGYIRYFTRVYLSQKPMGIEQEQKQPNTYKLAQNYPNPFNPSTMICYQLSQNGVVSIKVYDALGREMRTIVNEIKTRGTYSVNFNASALPSGMYFYTMKAGNFSVTKKMLLIK
jgi:hypothetical protein